MLRKGRRAGGAGGGAIELTVERTLQLDGQISANGGNGEALGGGGGGAGGCIAIYASSNTPLDSSASGVALAVSNDADAFQLPRSLWPVLISDPTDFLASPALPHHAVDYSRQCIRWY